MRLLTLKSTPHMTSSSNCLRHRISVSDFHPYRELKAKNTGKNCSYLLCLLKHLAPLVYFFGLITPFHAPKSFFCFFSKFWTNGFSGSINCIETSRQNLGHCETTEGTTLVNQFPAETTKTFSTTGPMFKLNFKSSSDFSRSQIVHGTTKYNKTMEWGFTSLTWVQLELIMIYYVTFLREADPEQNKAG